MHQLPQPRWVVRVLLVACALGTSGCASLRTPQANPTSQGAILPTSGRFTTEPRGTRSYGSSRIDLLPAEVIAPVHSEVVMIAGACGQDGYFVVGERIEWMLAPDGVGHFLAQGEWRYLDWLRTGGRAPRKVDNTFAIGRASPRNVTLTRGTPTLDDDVSVLRGQTWITVTSPVEGTSYVTAYAPDVYGWDGRKKTATIHWIDAQWTSPPPAINPVGTTHQFTTTVSRHTDATPVAGWRVRYEIVSGPPAGFAPDGAQLVEVTTNELGQAGVEIFQKEPVPGTNQINIKIVRPPGAVSGDAKPLVIGTDVTQKTWTAPQIALRKTGPAQASLGSTVVYQLEITNPGDLLARDVVVTDQLAPGLAFLSSNPPATVRGDRLEWRLAEVAPGQTETIEVDFRAETAGIVNNCATVQAADGLTARDCASTTIMTPTLEIDARAPPTARVGDSVTFEVTVTNRGDIAATGVTLVSRFDEGLVHESGPGPIERDLGTLEPAESRRVGVTLRVQRPGRLCNQIEAHGDGGLRGAATACVEAAGAAEPPVDTTPPAEERPPAVQRKPALSVSKTGPQQGDLGSTIVFDINVTNTGNVTLTNLKIVDRYDVALEPTLASEGAFREGTDVVWTVASLKPGQPETFQIHCRCNRASERACNQAIVTCDQGVTGEDEACLAIVGVQQPNLSLSVADRREPILTGNDQIYEVQVTNRGQSVARDVQIVAAVPSEMSPLPSVPSDPVPYQIDGQTVRFETVPQIPVGQTRNLQFRARADREGEVRTRVQLSAAGLSPPLAAEEETRIFSNQ